MLCFVAVPSVLLIPAGNTKSCCPLLNGSLVFKDVPLGAGEHLQDLILDLLQLLLVVRPLHDQVVLFLLKIQVLPHPFSTKIKCAWQHLLNLINTQSRAHM